MSPIRSLLFLLVLGVSTILLTALVVLLSLRLRSREMETLNRIGASRFTTVKLIGAELAVIILLALALAAAGTAAASFALQDVAHTLS